MDNDAVVTVKVIEDCGFDIVQVPFSGRKLRKLLLYLCASDEVVVEVSGE